MSSQSAVDKDGPVQRVAVVGSGGSGKSTLADRLGELTGLPVTHLDRLYWQPGWVATDDDRWRQLQAGLVAGERWIVDGNYGLDPGCPPGPG
jgi:adenylate kinase family enzyme